MLLVAMGYNASSEGMVGSDWEINTNALAVSKGLYDELDDVNPTEPLNRDNAAQMLFNTCDAPMVEYKNGGVTIAPDGTISTNSGTATDVTKNNKDVTLFTDKFDMEDEEGYMVGVDYEDAEGDSAATYHYTIDTEHFDVTCTTAAHILNLESTEDGSYANLLGEKVKVLYKESNNKKEIFGIYSTSKKVVTGVLSDLGTDKNISTVKVDGTKYNTSKNTNDLPAYVFNHDTGKLTRESNKTVDQAKDDYAKPSTVKAVANSSSGKIDFLVVTPVSVREVTSLSSSTIRIKDKGSFDLEDDIITYDDIAKGDYVIFTEAKYTVTGKAEAKETEKVSGIVEAIKGDDVRIDGTWYKKGGSSMPKVNDDVELVIVGEYYYNSDTIDGDSSVDDLLFVSNAAKTNGLANRVEAEVVFADGTVETVQISKVDGKDANDVVGGSDNYQTANKIMKGGLYSYEVNSSGYYEVDYLTDDNKAGFDSFNKTETGTDLFNPYNGNTEDKIPRVTANGTKYHIDDNAVVFLKGNGEDAKVITGSELKDWDTKYGTTSFVLADKVNGNQTAKVVALYSTNTGDYPNSSGDSGYGYLVSDAYYVKEDGDHYAVVNIWDGEELLEDVRVESLYAYNNGSLESTTSNPNENNVKKYESGKFVSFSYLNNGNVNKMKAIDNAGLAIKGISTNKDGDTVLTVTDNVAADKTIIVDDDTKVVYVDTDAKEGAEDGEFTVATDVDKLSGSGSWYVKNIWSDTADGKVADAVFVDVNNVLASLKDKDDIKAADGKDFTISGSNIEIASGSSIAGNDVDATFFTGALEAKADKTTGNLASGDKVTVIAENGDTVTFTVK